MKDPIFEMRGERDEDMIEGSWKGGGGRGEYQSRFPAHIFPKSNFPVLKSYSHKQIQKKPQCYTYQLFSLIYNL